MANKQKQTKDIEQNSLAAKELQKFLNKVQGVMLIPKDKKFQDFEYAVLCLLLSPDTYRDFKDYDIKKIIVDLLDNKYPVLSIRVDESQKDMAGLSILDEDTGLQFNLPDQGISQTLLNFVKTEKPFDKIAMMCGIFENGKLSFDPETFSNLLLILDGWRLE